MTRTATTTLPSAIAVLLLAGCGGGGGGGDGNGGSGTTGGTVPVPATAPAGPTVTYVGPTTPADISTTNAPTIADDVLSSFQLAWILTSSWDTASAPTGEIRETVPGPQGGSATIVGRIGAGGNGWLQVDYANYRDGGVTLNGREVQDVALNPQATSRSRRSFYGLSLNDGTFNATITCNLILEQDSGGAPRVLGDLLLVDNATRNQLKLESITLNEAVRSGVQPHEFTYAGRLLDSLRGYVDVASESPLLYVDAEPTNAFSGGPLRVRGGSGKSLWLSPLNANNMALELDLTARGVATQSVRLKTATEFESQVVPAGNAGPLAELGPEQGDFAVGTPTRIDGRYSTHPDGKFLTHAWRIVHAPPGSAAVLTNVDTSRPSITMDLPGDYVLADRVSDGARNSEDTVMWTAGGSARTSLRFKGALPPDRRLNLGQTFTIDGSAFGTVTGAMGTRHFDVVTLSSNQISALSSTGDVAYFTPSAPGAYRLGAGMTELTVFGKVGDTVDVFVDTDVYFRPEYRIRTRGIARWARLSDLDGDGRQDWVSIVSRPSGSSQFEYGLITYRGTAAPSLFSAPVLVTENVGPTAAIGDLTGDGRKDIVVRTTSGFTIYPTAANGSVGTPITIDTPTCDPGLALDRAAILAQDYNGDGRADLVAEDHCGNGLRIYTQQANGTLGPATVVTGVPRGARLGLADLNRDGRLDLIAGSDPWTLSYRPQLSGGGLGPAVGIDLGQPVSSPSVPGFCTADLNGDTETDLIVVGQNRIQVVLQLNTGLVVSLPDHSLTGLSGSCAFADLSRDGRADVHFVPESGRPQTFVSRGSGQFGPAIVDARAGRGGNLGDVTPSLVDLDADGFVDLAGPDGQDLVLQLGFALP